MAMRPKQLTACSLFNIFRDHPQTFVAGITDGVKANGVLGIRECVFISLANAKVFLHVKFTQVI